MLGFFKSKEQKTMDVLNSAAVDASSHFLVYANAYQASAGLLENKESFWHNHFTMGILAGFTEIAIHESGIRAEGEALCLGIYNTVRNLENSNLVTNNTSQSQEIAFEIIEQFRSPSDRFLLGHKRAAKLLQLYVGRKTFDNDEDFVDIKNYIANNQNLHRNLFGKEWDNTDDKSKIYSMYISEKLVKEALGDTST